MARVPAKELEVIAPSVNGPMAKIAQMTSVVQWAESRQIAEAKEQRTDDRIEERRQEEHLLSGQERRGDEKVDQGSEEDEEVGDVQGLRTPLIPNGGPRAWNAEEPAQQGEQCAHGE